MTATSCPPWCQIHVGKVPFLEHWGPEVEVFATVADHLVTVYSCATEQDDGGPPEVAVRMDVKSEAFEDIEEHVFLHPDDARALAVELMLRAAEVESASGLNKRFIRRARSRDADEADSR